MLLRHARRRPPVLALLLLLLPAVTAAVCIDYTDSLHWVARMELDLSPDEIAVSGGLVFVASAGGIHILDVGDPAAPQVVGFYDGAGDGIAVDGDVAYTTAGYNGGLVVIDVSDPTAPSTIGDMGDQPDIRSRSLAVLGDHVVLALGADGILVIDVSDPTTPQVAGSVDTPDDAMAVAIHGDHAFVADRDGGLQVVSLVDPTNPEIVNSLAATDQIRDVMIVDGRAYVAAGDLGVMILDVTDPEDLVIESALAGGVEANLLAVGGGRVFAKSGFHLFGIDAADPTAPAAVGQVWLESYSISDMAVAGDHLILTYGFDGIEIYDVTSPASAQPLGHLELAAFHYAEEVAATPTRAYMVGSDIDGDHLSIVDLAVPSAPAVMGVHDLPSSPQDVIVSGPLAFVGTGSGLSIVDVSDPAMPASLIHVPTPDRIMGLALADTHVYAAAEDEGLKLIHVADPGAASIAGSVAIPDQAQDVAVEGQYAYVAADVEGLQVVDVSDPSAPMIVGNAATSDNAKGITLMDGYAVLAIDPDGLDVVDISEPTAPVLVGSIITPERGIDVTIVGTTAYVATHLGGLHVVDLSDPLAPAMLGHVDSPGIAQGVAVAGDLVVLADERDGLLILPTQCDTEVPVLLSGFAARQDGVEVRLGWSYGLDGEPGDFLLEAHDDGARRTLPVTAAGGRSYAAIDRAAPVDRGGRVLYTLSVREPGGAWLRLAETSVRLTPVRTRLALAMPAPNPFNPTTRIDFELPRATRVVLTVHDAAGRRVRTLHDGVLPAGPHTATWDGRDDAGRAQASGTYLVRLRGEEGTETGRKVMLVR